MVKAQKYQQVGGLDEDNLAVAYNDVDFCLRVQERGYKNLWTPYAELYHHESISRGKINDPKKRSQWVKEANFIKTKWEAELKNDPYYSPNLSIVREDFSFRQ